MTERDVFEAALELPLGDRTAFLDGACEGNGALRQRLQALLSKHDQAGSFLEYPVVPGAFADDAGPKVAEPPADAVGQLLAGRYKLLEQIGEGGFGVVYMAEQTQPVRRKVALKILKPGMDTSQVVARFEAERQALAIMDHPNIAKVHDGGATASGRPYFVMELVKGVPITEFCDQNQLTPRQRLELFIPVCQAVQHAHQKGVIHRDLKPSNILVTVHDTTPLVKVIDFGIAKAISQQLTEKTLFTGFAQLMGTPLYMSPEQAGQSGLDVDTRSDIYSLGVLLYELLTGTTPFPKERFKQSPYDEICRIIREEEPPKPSTRLSELSSPHAPRAEPGSGTRSVPTTLASVAAQRHMEPAKLTKLVRGELDWIVMKALEKNRDRRYETANGFAMDVQRYLADEPVVAGPPSAGYRLWKFVRRNKGRVAAVSLVLVSLVAGVIGTSWGLVRAEQRRQEAETAWQAEATRAEGERLAREEEEKERKFAQAIAAFVRDDFLALTSVEGQHRFGSGSEDTGLNKDTTLRDLLDRAAGKLYRRQDLDPRTEAELNWFVGVSYRGVGEAKRALPHLERCVELRQQVLGREDESTLSAQHSLAVAYRAAGRLDKALPLSEDTLQLATAKLGLDHHTTLNSMANLAAGYLTAGRFDKALPLLEETVELQKARLGPGHPNTLSGMNNLTDGYLAGGRLDKALPLSEETLQLATARLGPDHPMTITSMRNRAQSYLAAGQLHKALPLQEESLQLAKAKLGADHPDTLMSMNNLATGYRAAGQLEKSLPLFEETLRLRKARLGPDHPYTLVSMNNLALGYKDAGQRDKALPLFEETLERTRAMLGPEHPYTFGCMNNLAGGYRAAGRLDKALPLFEELFRLIKAKFGPDHPDTLQSMNSLASGYWSTKRLDLAVPLFEEVLRLQEKKLGRTHPETLITVANLGVNYKDAGRLEGALPLLEEAYQASHKNPRLRWVGAQLLDGYAKAGHAAGAATLARELLAEARKTLPRDSSRLAGVLGQYGSALLQAKAFTEAEALLRECLAICEKAQPDAWSTFFTQSLLGGALLGQKKYAEAEPLLLAGYEGMKLPEAKPPPDGKMRLAKALERLVQLYDAWDKKEEAARWQKELDTHKTRKD